MLRRAPKILLSYRRADTGATAGRLADHLKRRFGTGNVFIDVDNIPYGRDFRDHIHQTISNCDVVIALIGPSWTGAGGGQRRIDEAEDHLRIEIETAFETSTAVIPVLTDFAKMPAATDLPPSISKLAFINAAPLSSGRDFEVHTKIISEAVQVFVHKRENDNSSFGSMKSNLISFVLLFVFQYMFVLVSAFLSAYFALQVLYGLRCFSLYCSALLYLPIFLMSQFLSASTCAVFLVSFTDMKINPFAYIIATLLALVFVFKFHFNSNVLELNSSNALIILCFSALNVIPLLITYRNKLVMRFISKIR